MTIGARSSSPYIETENRLADVIAGIQAAGTYKFYKLDFKGWADRISGDISKADHWRTVFEEHPEFFRLDTERQKGSLVLRRQQTRSYNVDTGENVSKADYDLLDIAAKARFSRRPLDPDQIGVLINVAISLHDRAVERARDKRWWIPPALGFVGALLGGVIAAALS